MNEGNRSEAASEPATGGRSELLKKGLLLGALLAVFGVLYYFFGDQLSLEKLAAHEARFRSFQKQYPVATYGVAFLVYAAVTGLSLPGAAVLTLAYGWFFGFWRAVIVVSFASTTGATLAFLLSRYLLRDTIRRRFQERVEKFDRALEREGPFYLFTLRLIPAVPFFVINVVMGLTPMRVWTYWWISQVGMLPGTSVYVYAGSTVPTLEKLAEQGTGGILTPQIIVAFVILGLFPLIVRKVMGYFRAGERPGADAS